MPTPPLRPNDVLVRVRAAALNHIDLWVRTGLPRLRLTFEEAASIPLVFLTAWNMLVTNGRLRLGETVLIWGAGSGVGSAGIQIAKLFNARVIAVAGGRWKLDKARALGADEGIDHRE